MSRDASHLLDGAVLVLAALIVAFGVALRAAPSTRPLALTLALAAVTVLTLRRRAPTATLVASGALVVVLFAVDHAAGAVAVVAPAIALYSLALSRDRLHLVAAVVAAAAAVAAVDVYLAGGRAHALTLQTAAHVALVAVPVLAAEALRNRRSYVRLLLERLELAETMRQEEGRRRAEQERMRIARDLHDVVAHTLTTINVQAGAAAHLLDRDLGNAREALAVIESASHEALDELRAVLGVLRDPGVVTAPLEPAPGLDSVSKLVDRARSGGIDVSLEFDGRRPNRVPDAVQLAAYRIVQESLTNATKHAGGSSARVRLSYGPERLRVRVENANGSATGDGRGLGVGIIGMRERAAALGGTLTAAGSPRGFRVEAELPYARGR